MSAQPNNALLTDAYAAALRALTEESEDDPVTLTDDDFWRILQVLKTVADCMHSARRIE